MPKVSVIIPSYNYAQYLGEAVHSVLNQTYQDFEIIIVDDGSTDNTRELVRSFANPKINYIYQENRGVSAAENAGIRAASGDYIAILGADDQWLPQKLELQIKALESSPWASVVYSDVSYFGSIDSTKSKTFFQLFKWPPPRGRVLDRFAERNFCQPSTMLIKRAVFDKVGFFDEKLKYCDDYDLQFRIAVHFEFEVIRLPLVKYRLHGGQLSHSNVEGSLKDHITLFNKAAQLTAGDPSIRRKLDIKLARFHYEYGIFSMRQGNFIKAKDEIMASLRSDTGAFILLSLITSKRIVVFLFKRALKSMKSAMRILQPRYSGTSTHAQ